MIQAYEATDKGFLDVASMQQEQPENRVGNKLPMSPTNFPDVQVVAVLRWDQIFISIMPILGMEALNGVLNDPSWWPIINWNIVYSYWAVAAGAVVVYDWALTLGQEIELIWHGWQIVLTPKCFRYVILDHRILLYIFCVCPICAVFDSSDRRHTENMPLVSLTDAGCNIINYATNGTNVVVAAMLGVIMIARLHAMNQRSSIMLIFLVIIFLAINIACGVIAAITLKHTVAVHWIPEEVILSGTYMCNYGYEGDIQLLFSMIWMLNTVWEVLALCLSLWIAVKHFRTLRRLGPSTGSTIGDCFRVLIKSHVLYFASSARASFVCVSCFELAYISPQLSDSNSMGALILDGALQIFLSVQMFVLGPRLILSVREYHAKLVAGSDAETSMNSIVFQERVHVPTGSTV
ncbi:hypothetical protein EV702DRAFT_1043931 [Suillus placidus]|uniref:DUF6533 domain-containing protein n=1 Tax=Suillus placidus TaxID=48579 RepID=A0A9P6ZYW2_9AGAM|nr:hypothetical protein EV702DRAFT_1043931 [Suillus placidus]